LTSGREFEDQWERVYVPVIEKKYQNMRNNIGNDIRETVWGTPMWVKMLPHINPP
jgi:hypothetical protein